MNIFFFKRKSFYRRVTGVFIFLGVLFLNLVRAEEIFPSVTQKSTEIFLSGTTEEMLMQNEDKDDVEKNREGSLLKENSEIKLKEESFGEEEEGFSENLSKQARSTFESVELSLPKDSVEESGLLVEVAGESLNEEDATSWEESEIEEKKTGTVFFNEVAWMGSENSSYDEWIELYNPNDFAINLSGWRLSFWKPLKNSAGQEVIFDEKVYGQPYFSFSFPEGSTIVARGFFLVAKEKYNQGIKDLVDFFYKGTLVNEGGYLELRDEKELVIDFLDALRGWPKGESNQKKTMERSVDGKNRQTSIVTGGTPKKKNSQIEELQEKDASFCLDYPSGIFLNEILPNPEGSDTGNEWLEIVNKNDFEVNLTNWWLVSSSGKKFFLEGIMPAGEFLKINFPTTFILKNQKEFLKLFSCQGIKKEEVFWEKSAPSGQSLNRTEEGFWRWSRYLTFGEANIFNSYPVARVKEIKEAFLNQSILFDASASVDADGDKLKFIWDFGDGRKSYLAKVRHTFTQTGKKEVVLSLSDGIEETKKKISLDVKKYPSKKIIFTKILPNPIGNDKGNEWISLRNEEDKKINLKGWKIMSGSLEEKAVAHLIGEDFFLKGKEEKRITQKECAFVLNNKGGYLALVYPDGEKATELIYSSIETGQSFEGIEYYLGEDKQWQWTSNKTREETDFLSKDDKENLSVLGTSNNFSWEYLFFKLGKEKTLSWEEMSFLDWQKRNAIWLKFVRWNSEK